MTLEESIEKRRERVANMTLAQARDLIAKTLAHSDMEIEFDKAVWMLLECADEKINGAYIKALEQEPFINKPCVSSKVCEHDKQNVLDKIRAEIDKARFIDKDTRIVKNALASGLEVAMQIIDKYKAESEVGDRNDD